MSNIHDLRCIDLATWRAANKQFPERPPAEVNTSQSDRMIVVSCKELHRMRSEIDSMKLRSEQQDKTIAALYQNRALRAKVEHLQYEAEIDRAKYKNEKATEKSVCYMCERPLVADKPIKFQFCTDCEMKMICTNTAKQQQQRADQNIVDEFGGCNVA